MALSRWLPYIAVLAIVAIVAVLALAAYALVVHRSHRRAAVSPSVPPVAVLGDSDSHSYQDRISFPPAAGSAAPNTATSRCNGPKCSRAFAGMHSTSTHGARTAPAAFRPSSRRSSARRTQAAPRGLPLQLRDVGRRMQRSLTGWEEAPALVKLMDGEPERWQHGIVIIRIGINTFGKVKSMNGLARSPPDPDVIASIDACIADYRDAVALIRARHPGTRFVLVGIFRQPQLVALFRALAVGGRNREHPQRARPLRRRASRDGGEGSRHRVP